jgi:hypothetical protein
VKTAVVTIRKEPAYRRAAVESGLKKLGYTILSKGGVPKSRDDLLCLWNRKAGAEEQMAEQWERRGGTVIIMENGYLQKVDKTTYALSVHGHNGSGWFPTGTGDRFSSLGFPLKEMVDRKGYDLVCAQRGIGSKLMASPPRWAEKTAEKLKAAGRHPRIRAHPGNFAPKVPLLDDLKGAARCVIWSSGAGVRALVEGIPVVHSAPHWICAGWEGNRVEALQRMAHGQWRHEEIATGLPFAMMRDADWGPTWA